MHIKQPFGDPNSAAKIDVWCSKLYTAVFFNIYSKICSCFFCGCVPGTILYKGPIKRFISLNTVSYCEMGVCGQDFYSCVLATPTLCVLVHCVICAFLQVCLSNFFGIFRNTIPNQSFQWQFLNSFPCRLTHLSRAQLEFTIQRDTFLC